MYSQVYFDFDSTLVAVEGIDELAAFLGREEEVVALTHRAMNGSVSVREAYDRRLAALNLTPRHLQSLERIYRGSLLPGAWGLTRILRDLGKELIVVSGGFREALESVARELGFHQIEAVDLRFQKDSCQAVESPLLESRGKVNIVEKLKKGRAVFIGDGMTDFAVAEVAEKMIPFFGVVRRSFIDDCGLESYGGANLLGLLPLILDEDELNEAWLLHPGWTSQGCELLISDGHLLNPARDYQYLNSYRERLTLLPGPTEPSRSHKVHEFPMLGHREPEYSGLHLQSIAKLKDFLGWEGRLLVASASATGMMEASLTSIDPSRVLSLETGAFARRWADIARATGHEVDVLKAPEREAISVDALSSHLQGRDYGVILITHSETSNGILNPVEELAAVIREQSNALILVDGVSSVGGIPICVDCLDAVVFGSQKCLALPPGLGFIWFSNRFEQKLDESVSRSFYFDLKTYIKNDEKGSVPFTPAVRQIQALNLHLSDLLRRKNEYLETQKAMAQQVWDFCAQQGLEIHAKQGFRSLTASSIRFPEGHENLVSDLKKEGIYLAGGYGEYKKTHFRIGHMGLVKPAELKRVFRTVEELI